MESVTDPKLLEDRLFYKLGEITYDRRKMVLAVGLIACVTMGSLISLGADWAESWGEGDLEEVSEALCLGAGKEVERFIHLLAEGAFC